MLVCIYNNITFSFYQALLQNTIYNLIFYVKYGKIILLAIANVEITTHSDKYIRGGLTMSNFGEFMARSIGQATCPTVDMTKDNRHVIIGHVRVMPEIGKEMKVLETILSPSTKGGNNVDVNYSVRTTSPVTDMQVMDGLYLWKVQTQSGRTYIIEIMGR